MVSAHKYILEPGRFESLDTILERMEDGNFELMGYASSDVEGSEVSEINFTFYNSELNAGADSGDDAAYSEAAGSAFSDSVNAVDDSDESATSDFPPSSVSTVPARRSVKEPPGVAKSAFGAIPNPRTDLAESRGTRQQRRRREMEERLHFFRMLAASKVEKDLGMEDVDIADDFIPWESGPAKGSQKGSRKRLSKALKSDKEEERRTRQPRYKRKGDNRYHLRIFIR
ncbi:MAG: hypothetical protein Q9165_004434 [Trypethelium subeluteriae]